MFQVQVLAEEHVQYIVIVKPNAKHESVEQVAMRELRVSVRQPARDGKANEAVCRAVAAYIGIAPSRVVMKQGFRGKRKILEVMWITRY